MFSVSIVSAFMNSRAPSWGLTTADSYTDLRIRSRLITGRRGSWCPARSGIGDPSEPGLVLKHQSKRAPFLVGVVGGIQPFREFFYNRPDPPCCSWNSWCREPPFSIRDAPGVDRSLTGEQDSPAFPQGPHGSAEQ